MHAEAALPSAALTAPLLSDPLLCREWFALAWSSEIAQGCMLARRALARDLLLWRSQEGLQCWRDLCVHRGARLSLGTIRPGAGQPVSGATNSVSASRDCLICPYHAWEYAPT